MYVSVVIKNKSANVDRFFTYKCDFEGVKIGCKVIVPFGKNDLEKEGFIAGILQEIEVDQNDLIVKSVISVNEKEGITEEAMDVALWMRERYFAKYIDCISLFANTHSGKMRKNRDLLDDYSGAGSDVQRLTFEQEMALDEIKKSIEKNEHRVFLLDGVTGSGKTEIYLRTVEKTLEKNKTAIVMVPEITLTKQLIDRFIYKLGKEKIAVIHSKLTKSEQREQWYDIKSGKKSVVIGARSACFAPLKNIGVIILDEEHDMSYKSQMTPKFHARDVAIRRGNINDGIVMLGSATPSVESMIKAHAGDYKRLVIKNRYNFVELPEVSVVDMREELKKGNTSIFSRKLYDEINRAIDSDKQVMLTINKKGYSTFVSCRNCGHVIKCQKCNVPMAYSKREDRLKCTYCGRVHNKVRVCPKCGSNYIKHFGAGTETVKEQVDKLFPNVKTRILDVDHAKRIGDIREIIEAFERKEFDILIGTQIIMKGLDFANVGLVGIIAADTWLNSLDYRGRERCFQNIVHSSGRAGRGYDRGKVVLQTYQPEDFAIVTGARQDGEMFFEKESQMRKTFDYPPYSVLCEIALIGKNAKTVKSAWRKLEKLISENTDERIIIGKKYLIPYKKTERMIKNETDTSFLETELGERKEIDDDTQQSPKCGDDKHKAITLLKLHEDSLCNIFETVKKFRDEMRERREGISVVVDVDPIKLWRI